MKFGEKVRQLRKMKKLSQTQLSELCGLSLRTIRNYEAGGHYPKQRSVYAKLADILDCDVNYLLAEDEMPAPVCGAQSWRTSQDLVADIAALFSGDMLSEREKDALMQDIERAYWNGKLLDSAP